MSSEKVICSMVLSLVIQLWERLSAGKNAIGLGGTVKTANQRLKITAERITVARALLAARNSSARKEFSSKKGNLKRVSVKKSRHGERGGNAMPEGKGRYKKSEKKYAADLGKNREKRRGGRDLAGT